MSKNISQAIRKQFNRLRLVVLVLFFLFLLLLVAVYVYFERFVWDQPLDNWLPELAISSIVLIVMGLVVFITISIFEVRARRNTLKAIDKEFGEMRAANNRAKSLQAMASTLSATLSFERVMEVSLDVCSLALEEMGIPARSLVGAVYLYDDDEMISVATRRFVSRDHEKRIAGESGIVAEALDRAEPAVTNAPKKDPELKNLVAFQGCFTAIAIPLRAGFRFLASCS